jgi:hypothetical protein
MFKSYSGHSFPSMIINFIKLINESKLMKEGNASKISKAITFQKVENHNLPLGTIKNFNSRISPRTSRIFLKKLMA